MSTIQLPRAASTFVVVTTGAVACALLTAARTIEPPQAPPVVQAEMRGHYLELFAIHDAVAQGELETARRHAMELAYFSVPAGSPISTMPLSASIRQDARRLARETTVTGAARATTAIIRTCAECHHSRGVALPDDVRHRLPRAVPAEMREHASAADDMLLGLLLSSDESWTSGADRLERLMPQLERGSTTDIDARFRYLLGQSREAKTIASRSSQYVQLLSTCAGCHTTRRQ